MTSFECAKQGTNLLQTILAKPWHFRRNGRYYLRLRPRSTTQNYFTISLRTADRTTAMDISKDILRALAVFHLDNPAATWEDLRPRLLVIAEECLTMAHGDDSLVAYEMIYDELKSALTIASAHKPFTEPQQRTVGYGKRIMTGSQDRLKGDPEPLLGIIRELSESEDATSAPLSVFDRQAPLLWDDLSAQFMKEHKANIKDSSLTQIVSNHKIIGETLEACGLDDLRKHTRADMVAVRAELLETRKPSTVNTILAKLIAVMAWGVANDYLVKAYTSKLKFTKGTESAREAFKRDQVEAIMNHANSLQSSSWERWALSLLVVTGARVGEVLQLTKGDIKEVEGHWCISINEEGEDKSIKNKHSERVVPLTDGALGFDLEEFLKAVEAGYLPSDCSISVPRKSGLLRSFVKEVLGVNKTENQTLHSLRHHMASSLQARGVPATFTQGILGHASNSISYDTYGSGVPVDILASTLSGVWSSVTS
ncbi:tyrosine-type recombinase/integrase [Pseudomonas sp. P9_31]|uniref:tyrosine-type recombinase/integrase n=1 Tax=Pseudomonas sp. P9_31 TaxID=3043448 RepID=UPI002A36015D|nr:tyrosine-type recombinase/integrase [Pseudomonas sp. P9_31]WPN56842.1 tyrosine-type recombinase/integrase [Pseudomonas sp. P9_31]